MLNKLELVWILLLIAWIIVLGSWIFNYEPYFALIPTAIAGLIFAKNLSEGYYEG